MNSRQKTASSLNDEEALAIAIEAYVYASPIVQMEVHRRVLTNQAASDGRQMRGPINQFTHLRDFPDASVREVVGPNFDTIYSWLWYDVSDEPLVSIDYTSNPLSSIVDTMSTSVMQGRMVKLVSWYDNEWGYSCRVVDLVSYVGERL